MEKLWAGRFKAKLCDSVSDFNSSIRFDSRLIKEDINGSIAHATMLGKTGIISESDSEILCAELNKMLEELESGKLSIDYECEDVHSFVESVLTKRLGDIGRRLHTARSRNDQVAVDMRMYVRTSIKEVICLLKSLIATLKLISQNEKYTIMSGYTHMQRAQPITLAQHLMAYAFMFKRDAERLSDCLKRVNVCPLGSGALAGTTHPIDRNMTAELLGFIKPCENSVDGVSDRDFCLESAADLAIISTHMSRFSEEIILWCSWEFKYMELSDEFSTGSSIMPQKKNPDIAELVRGKTGRVYGNLMSLLTVMKGIPLAYNKDMQEDKESLFDSFDTVKACLSSLIPMLSTAKFNRLRMRSAAEEGFINATDCADYLVKKGMPFRTAYKLTGELVMYCIDNKNTLSNLPLDIFKQRSELFENDIYDAISLETCVEKRISLGSAADLNMDEQLSEIEDFLKDD